MAGTVSEPHRPSISTVTGRLKASSRFAGRYLTADFRPSPNFVILGTQRGGTTSLYRWLSMHHQFTPALRKEVHYFDRSPQRHGTRWYRAHFPIRRPGQFTGEASPYMLFHPLAPARAAEGLPTTTRFIVSLREPAQRAISHYSHWRRLNGWETEPLERAIELEPERLAGEYDRVLRGEWSFNHMAYSYVARGEYAPQLRRWFDAVGRDRILVLESEQLCSDPATSQRVLDWLGLEPHRLPFPDINRADKPDVGSQHLIASLQRHFEPHNRELFELLGYEMWTDASRSAPTDRSVT